jgi:glucose-6-phosphate isomerase
MMQSFADFLHSEKGVSVRPLNETEAYRKLLKFAEHPINLTEDGVLSAKRIHQMRAQACGYNLLYGTERVTEEVMLALSSLAEEQNVHQMMERMQSGEVINCIEGFASENRAVLHTSLRDLFDHPQTAKPAQEAAKMAKKEIDALGPFLKEIHGKIKTLVVIGIGGSELGPKALYIALEAYKHRGVDVKFVGNIDPDDLVKTLKDCNLKETLVAIVSKSGTTQETCVNEQFARRLFEGQVKNVKEHFVAVTGEGSPLDDLQSYRAVFHMWDWIGGRYSASSVIGGLIIGFSCGIDVYMRLLKGAHEMDLHALQEKDPLQNLPLLAALLGVWNHNFLKIQTTAIIPYCHALWRFTAHLQQLDMESNGKHNDRQGAIVSYDTGPIVWGEAGTNAQHSFYQWIHQGTETVALELIGYAQSQTEQDFTYEGTTSQEKLLANLIAQAIALAQGQESDNPNQRFFGNRPSFLLVGKQLTPEHLGALLAFYEHKVAFQGFLWNINSFDQEGVQLGKVLAKKVLKGFEKPNDDGFALGRAYRELIQP